jgi:hypothetical protein
MAERFVGKSRGREWAAKVKGGKIKREGRWEGYVRLEVGGMNSYHVDLTPRTARRLAIALLTEAEGHSEMGPSD